MNILIKPCIILILFIFCSVQLMAEEGKSQSKSALKKAFIDGSGHGWRALTGEDFVNVNCNEETWRWEKGHAFCTGKPV